MLCEDIKLEKKTHGQNGLRYNNLRERKWNEFKDEKYK